MCEKQKMWEREGRRETDKGTQKDRKALNSGTVFTLQNIKTLPNQKQALTDIYTILTPVVEDKEINYPSDRSIKLN